jgi:hypothetical protein
MVQNNSIFRFRLFIYLASAELFLSGVITAFLASRHGLLSTLVLSVVTALTGFLGLFVPTLLKRKSNLEERLLEILKGMTGKSFPFIVILLLAAFFFFVAPISNIAVVLSPLLICIWLIGLETLLLFGPFQTSVQEKNSSRFGRNEKILGIISAIFAYGFLLLPSRIPTWFDGFPWDSPPEFVFAAFILPLTFAIGWKVLSKRFFVFSFIFLFVVKFIFFIFLPQAGLGIYAFSTEEAVSANKWERSYYTFATPNYTQVINHPYYALREFPIEWINNRFGFEKNQFWLKLGLSGYIILQKDERLVFITQGAKQVKVELLDTATQKVVPLVFIERIEDANAKLYKSIPASREVKIRGTLLFDIYGKMRLEPILLYPDGSTKSLFDSARIWSSLEGANYPVNQVNTLGFILDALSLSFAGLIFAGLFIEIRTLWKDKKISLVDLYLASSSLSLFFIAMLVHKQYMNVLELSIILIFFIAKLIDLSLYQRYFSGKIFLFSIGIALLLLFIAFDINELRMVNNFPPYHDGLEYQTFAHNIYLNRDIFLANTPPRAYKVLFPYIVGVLHILFGQSVVPQLFFYAWCAVLSSIIIFELMKEFRMPTKASFGVAVYYFLILFLPSFYMYYFHFGLIEPFPTTLLLLTYYFAIKRQRLGMFLSGIVTVLLRMDYLGITFTAILLSSTPMLGTQKAAWTELFNWLRTNWKLLIAYMTALSLPALLVVLGYFMFVHDYMLNAPDTDQTSFASIPESLFRVIAGSTMGDLRGIFVASPAIALLISFPLLFGFLLVIASVFLRTGIIKKLDLRLGLLSLSLLPAYIFVRPAVYLSRFSLPLFPLDLIIISQFLHQLWLQSHPIDNTE